MSKKKEFFIVQRVHRNDLKMCLDTVCEDKPGDKVMNDVIDNLDDDEMERIAEIISDNIDMEMFWMALEYAIKDNEKLKFFTETEL